jgi:membrane-associated phospholipid phosphatase
VLALWWRLPALFLQVALADAAADLSAAALKWAIPRHRPRVHALVSMPHDHSFPSGHAATSFACATVLAAAWPKRRAVFYALAVLIAFSRLYNGVHFPLDVLGGAVLGVAIAAGVRALRQPAARLRRSPRGSPAG